jgi:hypothetical protein
MISRFSDFATHQKLNIARLCALTFLVTCIAHLTLKSNRDQLRHRRIRTRFVRDAEINSELDASINKPNRVFIGEEVSKLDAWSEIKKSFNKVVKPRKKTINERTNVHLCPSIPRYIESRIRVQDPPEGFNATNPYTIEFEFTRGLHAGGFYQPPDCEARHRLLLVIPYKNRLNNLNYFLYHMHALLQRQELAYKIVVVEQSNDELFNKGVLMNGALLEMLGLRERVWGKNLSDALSVADFESLPFDCVTFHDVDLLPEDDR